jgi:iron complex transport system substrate-binding protein
MSRHIRSFKNLNLAAIVALLTCSCGDNQASLENRHSEPQRIAVIAPAMAEMLQALDLLDRVVAIGELGTWPPQVAHLPKAGGYNNPNVERVLELNADTLLSAKSQAAIDAHRRLEAFGVRVVALDTSTYQGIFAAITTLGETFDRIDAAQNLITDIRNKMNDIRQLSDDLPRLRVLFVVGRDPLYVAGPGSHLDELIRLTGGENVAHDATSPYQQMSLETILERLPEVIIDASDGHVAGLRGQTLGPWEKWRFLPAVRERHVYWVDPSRLVIPGIRLPEMADLMGQLIHPEVFGAATETEFLRIGAAAGGSR